MSYIDAEYARYLFDNGIGNPRNYEYYLDCIEKWFGVSIDVEYEKDGAKSLYQRIQKVRKQPELIGKKETDLRNAASKLQRYCEFREYKQTHPTGLNAAARKSIPNIQKDNVIDVLRFIADSDEKCATDVMYALTLLDTNVDKMMESVKGQLVDELKNNEFENVRKLSDFCDNITKLSNQIGFCLDALLTNSENAKKVAQTPNYEPSKIDYSMYRVDPTEIHFLTEDYTHKRIAGFIFDGKEYHTTYWKDALKILCRILYKIDHNKISTFVYDPDFISRVSYFSKSHIPDKNEHIPGTDLYIWTNLPANIIVSIIKKCLIKYNIPLNDFGILLRADYTELHK